jgi:opacity protein-like surface antigen
MTSRLAALVVLGTVCGAGMAAAQDTNAPAPGFVEVTYMPVGAGFVPAKGKAAPSFGNYGFGTSVTLNLNHYLGVEGELSTMLATTSNLQFGDINSRAKAPNMLSYTGNVVLSPVTIGRVVPYGTVGIGGLTMFARPLLGVRDDETFLATNLGAGVKWYAPNNRWGIRADYRFGIVKGKDVAPAFFGAETRYMHRVYGAVIINTVK